MPVRRPNLLDAFRRAHDVPAGAGGQGSAAPKPGATPPASAAVPSSTAPAAATGAKPATPKPAANGAVAPARTPGVTEAAGNAPLRSAVPPVPASRIDPPAARPGSPPRERLLVLALLLAVATLALVMLLRRDRAPEGTTDTVRAATPAATTAAPRAPVTNPAATPPVAGRSPQDEALYDARNRYTVRLIQYPNDAQGVALATEAYRWLVKNGYPAGSPILLGSGKGLVLVASAKPTQEELIPLRDNLRRLRYPTSSKTMPFSDAYIVQIDDVLAR